MIKDHHHITRIWELLKQAISRIDVEKGKLFFRGHDATYLASEYDFPQILYLLCNSTLPNESEHSLLKMRINDLMVNSSDLIEGLFDSKPKRCEDPLHTLLDRLDGSIQDNPEDIHDHLLSIIALTPRILSASWRFLSDRELIEPSPILDFSANVLHMMGFYTSPSDVRDFEKSLILHMDDPDNPSLSTLIGSLESGESPAKAISRALEVHVDPLHHGAGTLAMNMLLDLKDTHDLKAVLESILSSKQRIYGVGHRIYRSMDPRAEVLREILRKRTSNTELNWLPDLIESVSTEAIVLILEHKGKTAFPNVDLFNAAVYHTFGFPIEFNTCLFAISRVAGWMAHIIEFLETPL